MRAAEEKRIYTFTVFFWKTSFQSEDSIARAHVRRLTGYSLHWPELDFVHCLTVQPSLFRLQPECAPQSSRRPAGI